LTYTVMHGNTKLKKTTRFLSKIVFYEVCWLFKTWLVKMLPLDLFNKSVSTEKYSGCQIKKIWEGNVARLGKRRVYTRFWWRHLREGATW
jgi:hypothetical protein